MGQRPSKETARLDEINDEQLKVNDLLHTLYNLAAAEAAAGKPATPGSYQARRAAVHDYFMQLSYESTAIYARISECCTCCQRCLDEGVLTSESTTALAACAWPACPTPASASRPAAAAGAKYEGRHLPMPDPTPPLCLPPLPEPDGEPTAGRVQLAAMSCSSSRRLAGRLAQRMQHAAGSGGDGGSAQARKAVSPSPFPNPHSSSSLAAHAASACGGQPGTPMGSARSPTAQRGGSSSSEEGAHAGASGAQSSDAVPLLASGSGRLASGLRRRQGHQEDS